jgi:hypothetical protein
MLGKEFDTRKHDSSVGIAIKLRTGLTLSESSKVQDTFSVLCGVMTGSERFLKNICQTDFRIQSL